MKKSLFALSLFVLLVLSGCGKSVSVVEYNDSFVAMVKECTDANQALFNVFQLEDSTIDSISQSLENSITVCKDSQSKAAKMWDFDNDSSLKDAVVNLLSTEVEYLQKFWSTSHYRNIDDITDDDKMAYSSLVNELYTAEESLNDQFLSLQEIQETFASKHWLKLE